MTAEANSSGKPGVWGFVGVIFGLWPKHWQTSLMADRNNPPLLTSEGKKNPKNPTIVAMRLIHKGFSKNKNPHRSGHLMGFAAFRERAIAVVVSLV
jgi:hypothetical protein